MANREISQFASLAAGSQSPTMILPIVDTSLGHVAAANKQVTLNNLFADLGLNTSDFGIAQTGVATGSAPAVSAANQMKWYFNTTDSTFKLSRNTGLYGTVQVNNSASVTPGAGTTQTIDLSIRTMWAVLLPAGNITVSTAGTQLFPTYFTIQVYQDAVGGRTITWGGTFFNNSAAMTIQPDATANSATTFNFYSDGTNCFLISWSSDAGNFAIPTSTYAALPAAPGFVAEYLLTDTNKSIWAYNTNASQWVSQNGNVYNVQDFGAKANAVKVTGGIVNGGNTFTATSSVFAASDVGKAIAIAGAGPAGVTLITTISGFTSTTIVSVTAAASTTVVAGAALFGTDCTSAFAAALTALPATGGKITVPIGKYILTSGIDPVLKPVIIEGQGFSGFSQPAFGDCASWWTSASGGSVIYFLSNSGGAITTNSSGSSRVQVRDLAIIGSGSGTPVGINYSSLSSTYMQVFNVYCGNLYKGMYLSNVLESNFYNFTAFGCNTGIDFNAAGTADLITFYNTDIEICTTAINLIGSEINFENGLIQSNTTGIQIVPTLFSISAIHISGIWFEANTTALLLDTTSNSIVGLTVENCRNSNNPDAVTITGANTIATCVFTGNDWPGTNITLTASCTLNSFVGNRFNSLTDNGTNNNIINTAGTSVFKGASISIVNSTATTGNVATFSCSTLTSGNVVSISATGTAAASNSKTALSVATSGANGTATQTTYAAQFANTSTGATSTNIAALFTASGGTTNYAIKMAAGTAIGPDGSASAPTWSFINAPNYGMYFDGSNVAITINNIRRLYVGSSEIGFLTNNVSYGGWFECVATAAGGIGFGSGHSLVWGSAATNGGITGDTNLSRISAGLVGVGTGSAGSFAGSLKLTSLVIAGKQQNLTVSTGAGSALLGANSPAATLTAPFEWINVTLSDGSTGYVPAWK